MAITKTVFDAVKDSIKPYIDLNAGNIAAVEKTSTAAAAHLAGTQIVFKGKLYDVIQDIAQNGTIIVGTNIVAADPLSSDIQTLSNLVEGASEITTKSFSPVIAVNDALPVNAVDVLAKIEPIQAGSGTPSPSNVRAISGRTEVTVTRAGKNLIEQTIVNAGIGSNGQITSSSGTDVCIAKIKKDVTYSIRFAGAPFVYGFFENLPTLGSVSYDNARVVTNIWAPVTAPIDGYIAFRVNKGYAEKPSVEIGNALPTTYEAPNVNDYTIQLGDTYYGGTLDVTTGVLTVNAEYKTYNGGIGEDWRTNGDSGVALFVSGYSEVIAINEYGIHDAGYATYLSDGEACMNVARTALQIKDSRAMTESAYKTLLASYPLEVVFELATPITVQLTPQEIQMLQGNNTIFTDSGDTSIQYYANGVKNLEASVSAIQGDINGLANNQFQNECVNLLENKASSATSNGFTMIVNADKSVTANGSGSIYFELNTYTQNEFNAKFAGKSLKISGTPESLLSNDIRIYAEIVSSGTRLIDEYNSPIYTMPTVSGSVRFYIKINGTVTNAVFKPMLTVADMPNSDYAHYVPYAKSNRELTELWNANKYVEQAINWESNVDTYYDRTNTVAHFRVNEFTRHCVLDVTDLVTKFAMNAGEVTVLFNIGGSFIPFVNERKDVPILKKDSTYYSGFVTKASSHNGVSFTAKESIPSGTSITFTLDWTY